MDESQVDSWLEWTSLVVDQHFMDDDIAPVAPIFDVLESHLKTRTFLVGQRFTLADISLAVSLRGPCEKEGLPVLKQKYPASVRWLNTCVNQPDFEAPGAAPAKAQAQKPPAQKPAAQKASPKAPPKAAPAPAPAGGGDVDAAITKLGGEIRALKEKLKGEGLKGKAIDNHEEVAAKVKQLQELKAQQSAGGAPAPAKAAPAKASPKAEPSPAPAGEEGGSSKKADKKAAKDAEKKAKEEAKRKAEEDRKAAADAKFKGPDLTLDNFEDHKFGNLFVQSQQRRVGCGRPYG